jgi:gluconolactonase
LVDEKPLGPLDSPAYSIIDPRFASLTVPGARVERLWTGGKWVEGPAWLAASRTLVWSDIPGDRMLAWNEANGEASVFRLPANAPNGNTVDREGRLVSCDQLLHRITRTEFDGTLTVLADRHDGQRFNSPNDLVVKSDRSIWFTDPSYGRPKDREVGPDVVGYHVYRIDGGTGAVRQMTSDFVQPNGLAFSCDERVLYIVDTGSTHIPGGPNHVRRFWVGPDQSLRGGEILASNAAEKYDGLRIDAEDRLWLGCEDGVECRLPDGTLIGKINLPERAANLTFGGKDGDDLLITGTTSIYRCKVRARAAGWPAA